MRNNNKIWNNPLASSPLFCLPMRTGFINETKDITNEEIDYLNEQIKNLTGTEIILGYN